MGLIDIAAVVAAFLIGSVPSAYLVVRWRRGADIRGLGSGNVGATNVGRVLGWRGFVVVFVADAAKGALPVLAATHTDIVTLRLDPAWLGTVAVAAHCWTPWLRFQGGKGVATAVGALAVFAPAAAAAGFVVWAVLAAVTKLSSLGSLLGLVVATVAVLGYANTVEQGAFGAIAAIVLWRHRGNIQRLRRGSERRMGATST